MEVTPGASQCCFKIVTIQPRAVYKRPIFIIKTHRLNNSGQRHTVPKKAGVAVLISDRVRLILRDDKNYQGIINVSDPQEDITCFDGTVTKSMATTMRRRGRIHSPS